MLRVFLITLTCFSGITLFAQIPITFQLDMSGQSISPNGVHVAGSFQGWDPSGSVMTDMGDNIYETTLMATANSSITFKFINGNDWGGQETVPSECGQGDGYGGYNRIYMVMSEAATYGPVTFGGCPFVEPDPTVPVTFTVDMSEETVSAQGVHVAGDFQGWDPTSSELLPIGNGVYEGTFEITVNGTYYYKFINGDDWPGEESVPEECGIDNGVGGFDRLIQIGEEPDFAEAVCFGTCLDCGEVSPVLVGFRVDMSQETISTDGVFIAGTFNDFDPTATQLNEVSSGVYEAVFIMNPGEAVQYKFLNGPDFAGAESVPAECGEDDGYGDFNRAFTASSMPETLMDVCFGTCEECQIIIGQGEIEDLQLSVYPNPFQDYITIAGSNEQQWEVMDLMGKKVQSCSILNQTIDLSNLDQGIYLLRNAKGQCVRLIKQDTR